LDSVDIFSALKFVLSITHDSDNADGKSDKNNSIDNDSVIVTVVQEQVQEHSLGHTLSHVPSTSNNNNKDDDGPPSQHKNKVSSNEPKKIDESDVSNFNEKAKSEGFLNEESVSSPEIVGPPESTEANPAIGDSIS